MNINRMISERIAAKVSVIYHTIIETCKMCGVSTLEYFKEFFKAAIKQHQISYISPQTSYIFKCLDVKIDSLQFVKK